ncbi:MAG: acetate--CoA ligase family protein [Alphaproteobacteria bacterium]|nr:acetate--CoA ligase family protein [Alphaproteobacteria bacterium]
MAADLGPLLAPRSVAVIGAAADPTKIRGRVLAQLLKGGFAGPIFPIHPSEATIQGLPAFARIDDVPGPVDLAIVAIPAERVPDAVAACAARGVKAALVLSSGFAEEGKAALQASLREASKGLLLAGPNSVGLLSTQAGVCATFSPAIDFEALRSMRARLAQGRRAVGVVSQSGGLGFALFNRGLARGLAFSFVVTTGNEVDVDSVAAADAMLDDPATGAVLMFMEGARDGARFAALAEKALDREKPLIVAKIGRSAAAARAAVSHTASLTGADAAYDAVFRRLGVLRADDQDEMLDLALAATLAPPARGRRIGVVTISGGVGGWMADALAAEGLEVPRFSPDLEAAIRTYLPSYGAAFNPIDVTAQALENDHRLRSVAALMDSEEIDQIVVVSSLANDPRLAAERDGLAALAGRRTKPLLVYSYPLPAASAVALLAGIGIPTFTSLRGCASAARGLAAVAAARAASVRRRAALAAPMARSSAPASLPAGPTRLTEHAAAPLLASRGIAMAPHLLARDLAGAVAAAAAIGYPVALKVQSPDIPHKTEAGGVALALADAGALRAAWHAMAARIARAAPQARVDGWLVQRMAPPGIEMIVGSLRDADFGPLVAVGTGGTLVEVLRDLQVWPAPLTLEEASALIAGLRGAPLLAGVRGAPAADSDALARLVVAIGALAADLAPRVASIDLNPVIVHASGLTVVDALIETS